MFNHIPDVGKILKFFVIVCQQHMLNLVIHQPSWSYKYEISRAPAVFLMSSHTSNTKLKCLEIKPYVLYKWITLIILIFLCCLFLKKESSFSNLHLNSDSQIDHLLIAKHSLNISIEIKMRNFSFLQLLGLVVIMVR